MATFSTWPRVAFNVLVIKKYSWPPLRFVGLRP